MGVAGCGGGDDTATGSGELEDVSSVAVVKEAFDAHTCTPRLLLFLWPT